MRYYLKLVMEGSFPGSPDTETTEITESQYEAIGQSFFGWDIRGALSEVV